MKKVVCAIYILALLSGCRQKSPARIDVNDNDTNQTSAIKTVDEVEEEQSLQSEKTYIGDEAYIGEKHTHGKGLDLSGTPQERLAQLRKSQREGKRQVIEVRKPAGHALEKESIGGIQFNGINEKYIRTGPGMQYKNDDTGWLPETEPIYVLEEKDGWICFRVTEADLGWAGWIRKDLTTLIEK